MPALILPCYGKYTTKVSLNAVRSIVAPSYTYRFYGSSGQRGVTAKTKLLEMICGQREITATLNIRLTKISLGFFYPYL